MIKAEVEYSYTRGGKAPRRTYVDCTERALNRIQGKEMEIYFLKIDRLYPPEPRKEDKSIESIIAHPDYAAYGLTPHALPKNFDPHSSYFTSGQTDNATFWKKLAVFRIEYLALSRSIDQTTPTTDSVYMMIPVERQPCRFWHRDRPASSFLQAIIMDFMDWMGLARADIVRTGNLIERKFETEGLERAHAWAWEIVDEEISQSIPTTQEQLAQRRLAYFVTGRFLTAAREIMTVILAKVHNKRPVRRILAEFAKRPHPEVRRALLCYFTNEDEEQVLEPLNKRMPPEYCSKDWYGLVLTQLCSDMPKIPAPTRFDGTKGKNRRGNPLR